MQIIESKVKIMSITSSKKSVQIDGEAKVMVVTKSRATLFLTSGPLTKSCTRTTPGQTVLVAFSQASIRYTPYTEKETNLRMRKYSVRFQEAEAIASGCYKFQTDRSTAASG